MARRDEARTGTAGLGVSRRGLSTAGWGFSGVPSPVKVHGSERIGPERMGKERQGMGFIDVCPAGCRSMTDSSMGMAPLGWARKRSDGRGMESQGKVFCYSSISPTATRRGVASARQGAGCDCSGLRPQGVAQCDCSWRGRDGNGRDRRGWEWQGEDGLGMVTIHETRYGGFFIGR